MRTIKVYAKSAVDLGGVNLGAYSFAFVDVNGERFVQHRAFKYKMKTLAQADCAAYVNALAIMLTMVCSQEVEQLEIITDSGVVVDLLETYKAQKHCEPIALHWNKIKPTFPLLQKVTFKKISRKILSGDGDCDMILRLGTMAQGELKKELDHYK